MSARFLIPAFLIIATIAFLVSLGLWQLDRADQKRTIEAAIVSANAGPVELIANGRELLDKEYFHMTRSKRVGRNIDGIQEGREHRLLDLYERLEPMRKVLAESPFLGGDYPSYSDYVALSPFIWARTVSAFAIIKSGDPVYDWFQRVLDLYDGLARANPGYDW